MIVIYTIWWSTTKNGPKQFLLFLQYSIWGVFCLVFCWREKIFVIFLFITIYISTVIISNIFSQIASLVFFIKDVAWINVLIHGWTPKGLETFVDSLLQKTINDSGSLVEVKPNYVSLASSHASERQIELSMKH